MEVGVDAYEQAGVIVIVLTGEIDSRTAPVVEASILPLVEEKEFVLLDMEEVSYLSSAGLRLLLIIYRQITGRNGHVALAGLPPMIIDTMVNTGFIDFFEIYDTVEAGLAGLGLQAS